MFKGGGLGRLSRGCGSSVACGLGDLVGRDEFVDFGLFEKKLVMGTTPGGLEAFPHFLNPYFEFLACKLFIKIINEPQTTKQRSYLTCVCCAYFEASWSTSQLNLLNI